MNTGSALARFTITLSQAVAEPVQVEWFTSDGSAKAGIDYAANKGTVVFAPGETAKTVDILVYGRAVGTENRSFFVEMLPPTNAILGASIGECIITVDTSESTPVTAIIVPTGPVGPTGKSAYQSYLDTTTDNPPMTEAEWVESLKGDPAEIAQEVAPLIDVGSTVLTAEGTETLGYPDETTVKAIARRVAYSMPAAIATLVLADGDNTIENADLTGEAVDFQAAGFCPLILRSGSLIEAEWEPVGDKIVIRNAIAGDVLYAVEYSLSSKISGMRYLKQVFEPSPWKKRESFETGFTIREASEALLWMGSPSTDDDYYIWQGALPKTVPLNGSPATTGGIGPGAWKSVGKADYKSYYATPESDKQIGSSYTGSIYDAYAPKHMVRPAVHIKPTMTRAEIQAIFQAGGDIYVEDGQYLVNETYYLYEHTRLFCGSKAEFVANVDGITMFYADYTKTGTNGVRNLQITGMRIKLNGKNTVTGLRAMRTRNNSFLEKVWVDMGLGTNCTGILIDQLSYGIILSDPEILNGGVGSTRLMVRNGANAITIKDHRGYSGVPESGVPDYGIVVFNGLDGTFSFDYVNTFPTAAVLIIGGFTQNVSKYALLDSAVGTNVVGTYFENALQADVNLASGSFYFHAVATHHSAPAGAVCFRGRGASHAVIDNPVPATRTIGMLDFPAGNTNCYADLSKCGNQTNFATGIANGIKVTRGKGSVKQVLSTAAIDLNEGFETYRMNVTTGTNIQITGSPYDGHRIELILRGSELTTLSFGGVPINLAGANTTTVKNAWLTARYSAPIAQWMLDMPSWTA